MPNIPFEQEGQVRTDEQANPNTELQRDEKQFDPAHPPVNQPLNPTPGLDADPNVFKQNENVRTDEQEDPSKSVGDAYKDA